MKRKFQERKPINVQSAARRAKSMLRMIRTTDIIAFNFNRELPEIHIWETSMDAVAPMENWTLNEPRGEGQHDLHYPWEHSVIIDGVRFFVITAETITAGVNA